MSKIIAAAAIRGAYTCVDRAETMLAEAIHRHGRDKNIGFPGTAYALPVILSLLGKRVEKLGELEETLQIARGWLPAIPTEQLWLPYLGGALDAGAATLVAHEAVEVMKPSVRHPLGVRFLAGTDTGQHPAGTGDQARRRTDARICRLRRRPARRGDRRADRARPAGTQHPGLHGIECGRGNDGSPAPATRSRMNWETFLVPYGPDTSSIVHALGFACRAAMTFGGLKPGGLQGVPRDTALQQAPRVCLRAGAGRGG